MTHHYEVAVIRHARATPHTLFDVVSEGARWSEWAKPLIAYSTWDSRGPGDDGGVGAIRTVGTRRFATREMTTIHEPGQRHGYTILADKPVQNYQAEVTFSEDGGRTRIDWRGSFDSRWRAIGLPYQGVVRYVLTTLANKLVAEAERREAAAS